VRKLVITLVAALVVSGTSYGQSSKSSAAPKKQSKAQALRDNQMDRVTAAGEENTAVAAKDSTVTETNTGSVTVAGSVLQGAAGVNIVNSSDAMVANGANVVSNTAGGANITQTNNVSQNSKQTATIDGYSRGADISATLSTSSDVTKSASSSSSLNTSLNTSKTHDQSLTLSHSKTASLSTNATASQNA